MKYCFRIHLLLLLALVQFTSCNREDNPNPNIIYSTSGIYLAGTEVSAGRYKAVYWKNDSIVYLGDSSKNMQATGIFVTDEDVYVLGYEILGSNNRILYWKNGIATYLTDGTHDAMPSSILVSNNDVFVSGTENNGSKLVAKYWKNNISVSLTNGTQNATANAMCITNGDVYIAGHESNGSHTVATYWKNGNAVRLTDGTGDAILYSISVDGTNVYTCGHEWNTDWSILNPRLMARYWKNGTAFTLYDSTSAILSGMATSIFAKNNNVYTTAVQYSGSILNSNTDARFWSNNSSFPLNNAISNLLTTALYNKDGDIYIIGNETVSNNVYKPVLYKNGIEQSVSYTTPSALVYGLFVK